MARDFGLEAIVAEHLDGVPGVGGKTLFSGWVWFFHGHMLCGARHDGFLARVGRERATDLLPREGIEPMTVGRRLMPGWVRASPDAYADDALRQQLIEAALAFVATLPDKESVATSARTRQAGRRRSVRARSRPEHDPKA